MGDLISMRLLAAAGAPPAAAAGAGRGRPGFAGASIEGGPKPIIGMPSRLTSYEASPRCSLRLVTDELSSSAISSLSVPRSPPVLGAPDFGACFAFFLAIDLCGKLSRA